MCIFLLVICLSVVHNSCFRYSLSPVLYLPISLSFSLRFIPLMLMDNLPLRLPPCLSNQKSIKNTSPPSLQSQALVEGGIETIPEPLSLSLKISRLSYSLPLPPSSTYGLPISSLSSALLSTGSWQHDLRERRT